jgi:hypothetical protein
LQWTREILVQELFGLWLQQQQIHQIGMMVMMMLLAPQQQSHCPEAEEEPEEEA